MSGRTRRAPAGAVLATVAVAIAGAAGVPAERADATRDRSAADASAATAHRSGGVADTTGSGWRAVRLDLDVTVHPGEARIELAADMRLRLADHDSSSRIVLGVNSRDSIMAFDSVEVSEGTVRALDVPDPARAQRRLVVIDLDGPRAAGHELRVRAFVSSRKTTSQFSLAEDVALASWVTAWYPLPMPAEGVGFSAIVKAPGESRFDLPAGWRAVGNGVRAESGEVGGRMRERWVTEIPLARSFAAAPYRVIEGSARGRRVELFLLTVGAEDAHEQADALAGSIAALERRFGPYPTGDYAIAEVPEWVPGFLAASEQGFMMAKPANFTVPGGNIPLFAHEAAHGYWGNLLGSTGPGAAFLSESISQYGAVIALEEMIGPGAALDFLKFSREGYIPLQSARGFFEVVRRDADSLAISEMTHIGSRARRIVADSKGTWIYHMLRHRMGDERFFGALRSYLADHADGTSTLEAFRAAMEAAAPDADLPAFFGQWLDRTGAPRFEVAWSRDGDEIEIAVEQIQREEPFVLDLEVEVRFDGRVERHPIRLASRRDTFRVPAAGEVAAVVLDPDFTVLRWDETLAMPESDGG